MHQDLLSIMYYSYLKDDYTYVEEWIKNLNINNVSGLLANLYFMSHEEMEEEIGPFERLDVVEMFRIATSIFKKYLPDVDVIYSIEGCDYINSISELEELYDLGLRNILLVWNWPNKYGSGKKGDTGLTDEGVRFITRAVELGISIDLSHMNKKTFYDTIDLLEKLKDKKPIVIASHSNCYSLCNNIRNLDDEQIKALGRVDAVMGLVSYSEFVSSNSDVDMKSMYLSHIDHAVSILGTSHVGVSTDDMTFDEVLFGEKLAPQVFDYKNVRCELVELLKSHYSDEEIEKILYKNIYNKLF